MDKDLLNVILAGCIALLVINFVRNWWRDRQDRKHQYCALVEDTKKFFKITEEEAGEAIEAQCFVDVKNKKFKLHQVDDRFPHVAYWVETAVLHKRKEPEK